MLPLIPVAREGGAFNRRVAGESVMTRYAVFSTAVLFLVSLLIAPQIAVSQKAPTIVDFRAQPLYRSAKLTWKASDNLKNQLTVQILRAETFEEGPYNELEAVNLVPGKDSYDFIDKTVGSESKYFYKLVVKETGESYGPVVTRPYFSPPAT